MQYTKMYWPGRTISGIFSCHRTRFRTTSSTSCSYCFHLDVIGGNPRMTHRRQVGTAVAETTEEYLWDWSPVKLPIDFLPISFRGKSTCSRSKTTMLCCEFILLVSEQLQSPEYLNCSIPHPLPKHPRVLNDHQGLLMLRLCSHLSFPHLSSELCNCCERVGVSSLLIL